MLGLGWGWLFIAGFGPGCVGSVWVVVDLRIGRGFVVLFLLRFYCGSDLVVLLWLVYLLTWFCWCLFWRPGCRCWCFDLVWLFLVIILSFVLVC